MAYQRSTQATGFKNRVAPSEEKQYTALAKALKTNQVTDVKGLIGQGAEQITEMKRLSGLEAKADEYELAKLRGLSKNVDNFLNATVDNVIKPIVESQIQDGVNEAVKAGQGDEEAQAKVALTDFQNVELQRQAAEQREKVARTTDEIEQTWKDADYEASLEQKYRLQNLKKQGSSFALGYRRGMLMEAATGWDAFRDSALVGSGESEYKDRIILHEGTEYKVSDYYNIATPTEAKEKIVAALQNSYLTMHGAGLSKLLVNKYLTNPVLERTNLFNQKEFNRSQLEWADDQINYHKDQFENFHFADLESDLGKQTAQLGVQEWLNTGGSIMAATNINTSRNAASKAKLIELIVGTLQSDKFKNMDDSEQLLSFLEENRFYIPGISKKKNGTYELSSLESLMGDDLSTTNIRSELLQAIYTESREKLAGQKIQRILH